MPSFCHRFLPETAKKLLPYTPTPTPVRKRKPNKQRIKLTPEASQAVKNSKQILAEIVQLAHLRPSAPPQLVPDVSYVGLHSASHLCP